MHPDSAAMSGQVSSVTKHLHLDWVWLFPSSAPCIRFRANPDPNASRLECNNHDDGRDNSGSGLGQISYMKFTMGSMFQVHLSCCSAILISCWCRYALLSILCSGFSVVTGCLDTSPLYIVNNSIPGWIGLRRNSWGKNTHLGLRFHPQPYLQSNHN